MPSRLRLPHLCLLALVWACSTNRQAGSASDGGARDADAAATADQPATRADARADAPVADEPATRADARADAPAADEPATSIEAGADDAGATDGAATLLDAGEAVDGGAQDLPAAPRPNILVILLDDLGYGDLSCFGASDLQSPAIDRLAAEGMRFTDFHSNSPVCSPTRAALLTGRFPDLVGVPGVIRQTPGDSWGNLADDATMLGELLTSAGYHTAHVGKWHLGFTPPDYPLDRGFAFFHGFLADMMDDYYTHLRGGVNWMRLGRDEVDPVGHATDIFTEWAIDYMAERKGKPEPFFLYLAYNAPHAPIQPPAEWLERVLAREPGISEQRAAYVALVEHLDDSIGKVLQALADNGQQESTLVLLASDNGGDLGCGANNGPLHGTKTQMWEGGVRVPAVAFWPGRIGAGTTSSAVFMTMDIFATALEAAGVAYAGEVEARSFLPVLLGEATEAPARDIFFVRRENPGGVHYGARNGDYKLVQNTPDGPFMLYNLRADLAETTDLSATEPAKLLQLTSALDQHRQVAEQVPWQ
jgi:arylsulfatase A-like enzyme